MLQITPQHRILLAVEPADFRKGIDGLKALCKQKLFNDSFSGTVILCSTSARGIHEARLIHPMTKGFVPSGKFDECTNATICSTSSCDFSMTMGNSFAATSGYINWFS